MTRAVRDAIASLLTGLASRAGVDVTEILEITIVGNPIMHHLLLGIDPIPLGSAPFALATDAAVRVRARDLELPGHEGARVYVLPCIAGHVGADAAGAILAETPYLADEVTLLVDVMLRLGSPGLNDIRPASPTIATRLPSACSSWT